MKSVLLFVCCILSLTCVMQGQQCLISRRGVVQDNAYRCLDVWNYDTTNGTPIGAHECHASSNQQWTIMANENTFRALGKCMNAGVAGNVYIYDCNGSYNQQWVYSSALEIFNIGTNSCLESVPTSNPEVSTLRMAGCSGGWDQKWFLPTTP